METEKYITHSDFDIVQEKVDATNSPANIERIPGQFSSGFSGFTAEQLMVWTVIYSPVVLYGILPREHYGHISVFFRVPAPHNCVNSILVNVRLIELMNYMY